MVKASTSGLARTSMLVTGLMVICMELVFGQMERPERSLKVDMWTVMVLKCLTSEFR